MRRTQSSVETQDSSAQLAAVPQQTHHGLCTEIQSGVSPEAHPIPCRSQKRLYYAVTGCMLACYWSDHFPVTHESYPGAVSNLYSTLWWSTSSHWTVMQMSSYILWRQHWISTAQTRTQDLEHSRTRTNKPGPRATQPIFKNKNQ